MLNFIYRTNKSAAPLFIRLALGIVMFPHGAQKVLGWFGGPGFFQTIQTFQTMGFPPWSTMVLMFVELIGSLLLIAGLLTRIWALGFGISIAICMSLHHVQHGFFMNWFGQQAGEGIEYHILVLGIVLALIIQGGGLLSADLGISAGRDRGRQKDKQKS